MEGVPMKRYAGAIGLLFLGICGLALAQTPPQRQTGADDASGLPGRVERLEEQLVDLQGAIGAVETLAKSSASGSSGFAAASGGASTEQLRQLSDQIADLTQRVERLEARLGGAGGDSPVRPHADLRADPQPGFDDKQALPPLQQDTGGDHGQPRDSAVNQPLPQGAALDNSAAPAPATSAPVQSAALGPSSDSAKTLFDQAYGAFNRREYSAAETYFSQFLKEHPSDPLAGQAQFWLGESAFVSGEYKTAADRFLKAYTGYPKSDKAPEALLNLAISLRRLGQNGAACDSFAELQRRFPQAPSLVLKRADVEKRRANCA
jgi:tol-pal system protein YbgF